MAPERSRSQAVADAELVSQVPDLVDDLRLDDAIANGWQVTGPTPLEGGGMSITLTHPFHSAEELASVLNSIGPPLTDMQVARTTDPADPNGPTTNAIDGTLVLPNGYESFADAALVEAVGGQPFGDQIAASGLAPSEAMSFTFRVSLPGELVSSETGTEVGDGVIEWKAPLDGTSVDLLTQTVQRPAGSGNSWARPLSNVAFVLLIGVDRDLGGVHRVRRRRPPQQAPPPRNTGCAARRLASVNRRVSCGERCRRDEGSDQSSLAHRYPLGDRPSRC